MDAIQFSANKDGSIKAERVIAGVVVDRFNYYIKRKSVIKHNPKVTWIPRAIVMLEAPSVGIVIEEFVVPLLEINQQERPLLMELAIEQLETAIAYHNFEHDNQEPGIPFDTIPEDANSRLAIALAEAKQK